MSNTKEFSSLWYQHTRDDAETVNKLVGNSSNLLTLLNEVLEGLEKEIASKEIIKDSYDNPNWSHRQADLIGQKRLLSKIKSLTKHIK